MNPVSVFFYGSYMLRSVLREIGVSPTSWELATLPDYDIRIAPRANVVRATGHAVLGVLAASTHAELDRLYAHAKSALGEVYLPEPVIVLAGGAVKPALCYVAQDMAPGPADPAYVERILAAAREISLPKWYVERLEALHPRAQR